MNCYIVKITNVVMADGNQGRGSMEGAFTKMSSVEEIIKKFNSSPYFTCNYQVLEFPILDWENETK